MISHAKFALALTLVVSTAARATPVAYVVTDSQQFGTVDLAAGTFTSIGPGLAVGGGGLVSGPNGTLLTLTFSGALESINRATGVESLVGATGLGDCSQPASPCGPNSANSLGELGTNLYATDFQNNLYSVNSATGVATLIGATGMPALSFVPHSLVPGDPDGSFYFYDEGLFSSGGKLYANFDTGIFDPTTFTPMSILSPNLYQINPLTGAATLVGPTALGLSTAFDANGSVYAFDVATGEIVNLNVTNGDTTHFSDFDPTVGIINGAVSPAATPEPASLALVGTGLAAIAGSMRRRQRLCS